MTNADIDTGVIYYVGAGDFIKIGFSRNIEARLIKMITDVPHEISLLHVEPGTFRTEKILHRAFSEFRVRGEWFKAAPELLAHIDTRKRIIAGVA